jgi:hypothetical protein
MDATSRPTREIWSCSSTVCLSTASVNEFPLGYKGSPLSCREQVLSVSLVSAGEALDGSLNASEMKPGRAREQWKGNVVDVLSFE